MRRRYHVKNAPPKSMGYSGPAEDGSDMLDDATGEPLMQRPDDTAEALVNRLAGYHAETVPVLEHYRPQEIVVEVNANQGIGGVWGEIESGLARTGL